MNKIILLAKANIRKTKGQTAVLAILFLIASAMLNIGLILALGFGNFFENTVEELSTADTYFVVSEAIYNDEIESYFQDSNEVSDFQMNDILFLGTTLEWNGEDFDWQASFWNKDETRNLNQWKYVGETLSNAPDNAIYVPYIYNLVGGYELGDELLLTVEEEELSFVVAGYIEAIYHDRMMLGDVFLVSSPQFQDLSQKFDDAGIVSIAANGIENHARTTSDLLELVDMSEVAGMPGFNTIMGFDQDIMAESRTGMAMLTAAMLIVFTVIVIAVCLLVIRFRISSSIEEDIQKIGSLQSVGYTSKQLNLSFVLQYASIAFLACLAGVVPAYLMLPAVGDILAQQSGFLWVPGVDLVLNLVALVALTFVVAVIAFLSARRVRKITPVQALRGGLATHNFKRNYLPLERSRLPLTLALSSKSVLQGLRQSLTLFMILAASSFVAVVAVVLYYNSAIDLSAFEQVPGIERSNAIIVFDPAEDTDFLKDEILAHDDVWNAQYIDGTQISVEDIGTVNAVAMADLSGRVTQNVYEGIFPRYDNEIAIAGVLSNMTGLGIGDEILLGSDDMPFLITGLTQGMEAGVLTVYLTQDAAERIDSSFAQSVLHIYLNDGVDAAEFVQEMEKVYADGTFGFGDNDAAFAEGVSGFASILSAVGLAIVIIAGFVVVLVLYFVLGATVIRQRRDLGIQKAIGYTTMKLMNQMSLSFTLPIILAAIVGSVLAALSFNTLMSIGMEGMGVMRSVYIVNPVWVAATICGMIALSYLTSLLITWRIRKVPAYELVTE